MFLTVTGPGRFVASSMAKQTDMVLKTSSVVTMAGASPMIDWTKL
jgi:hypothetical protein